MATPLMAEFPELSSLSREDLEDLLQDLHYFQAMFQSLNKTKAMFQSQTELGMANEALARRNLDLQNKLFQLRTETQASFDDARSLEARWKEVEREQKELYQRFTAGFLSLRLRQEITAQDDRSEQLASTFVKGTTQPDADNGKDVDDFVREFKEQRKVYHKRVLYAERWSSGKVAWRED